MAKVKYADNLVGLKCKECGRRNYYTHKNKKKVERKVELKKYCRWDKKSTVHKEVRISGK
jgi:large subunit ribosomal protein L33